MANFILPIIPGFLPAYQVHLELNDRPADCNDPDASVKIRGYQLLEAGRANFLISSIYATVVQVIISISFESMKLLSTIFWGGAILSLASVAINVCLTLSASHEEIMLQAIINKTIVPHQ